MCFCKPARLPYHFQLYLTGSTWLSVATCGHYRLFVCRRPFRSLMHWTPTMTRKVLEGLTLCQMAFALTLMRNQDNFGNVPNVSEHIEHFAAFMLKLLLSHGPGDPLLWLFGRDGRALKSSIIASQALRCTCSIMFLIEKLSWFWRIQISILSASHIFSFPSQPSHVFKVNTRISIHDHLLQAFGLWLSHAKS